MVPGGIVSFYCAISDISTHTMCQRTMVLLKNKSPDARPGEPLKAGSGLGHRPCARDDAGTRHAAEADGAWKSRHARGRPSNRTAPCAAAGPDRERPAGHRRPDRDDPGPRPDPLRPRSPTTRTALPPHAHAPRRPGCARAWPRVGGRPPNPPPPFQSPPPSGSAPGSTAERSPARRE